MPDLGKLTELQPWCYYAASEWLKACEAEDIRFRVTEVYRTQARQDQLYKIGRRGVDGEKPVTWTKTSMHTQRLAADIIRLNCSYYQIEAIAKRFGIYRPPELVKLGDQGHFAFDKAILAPVIVDPKARLNGYIHRLKVTVDPYLKQELPKLIERLKKRLGMQ